MCAASRAAKQVASYLGLIPREESSGGRQKLGAITKPGKRMLRSLLRTRVAYPEIVRIESSSGLSLVGAS